MDLNLNIAATLSSNGNGGTTTINNDLDNNNAQTQTESATITTAPFVMAHNAAMAYLPPSIKECGTHKTQALLLDNSTKKFVMGLEHSSNNNNINDSPFTALLDCGACALDIRLGSKYSTYHCTIGSTDLLSNKLYIHHASCFEFYLFHNL